MYGALARAWHALASTRGLALETVSCGPGARGLLMLDIGDRGQRRVALSSGVHGDEPASPWALLSLVRDGLLDDRFSYRIWCCTNPSGSERGTRQNAEGLDVNRTFSRDGHSALSPEAAAIERRNRGHHFDLSLDLHEDYEARGFYCYEPVVAGTAPLGCAVVRAVDDAGLPVQDLDGGFDLGYPLEATNLRTLERGRVLVNVEAEVRHFDGLPYSMYLLWTGTAERTMTLESPCRAAWDDRNAVHRVAVVAALGAAVAGGT